MRVPTSVALSLDEIELSIGQSVQISAAVLDQGGDVLSGALVSWASADSGVASVDDAGWVAGIEVGETDVVANSGSLADTARVSVLPVPIDLVLLTPTSLDLRPGDSALVTAIALGESGVALPGREVAWSSSAESVATVEARSDQSALVRAVADGSAMILALMGDVEGGASVTVTSEPSPEEPVPTLLTVEPTHLELVVGQSGQLAAVVLDQYGGAMADQVVSWGSADEMVATVDSQGSVQGTGVGDTELTAWSGTVSSTVGVSVVPGPSNGLTTECAAPDPLWIWCDDFEADRLDSYFEAPDPAGPFRRASGVGVEGSSGMRARFEQGASDAGSLHLAFGRTPDAYRRPADAGTEDFTEVYWRVFLRHQDGWIGGGGDKLSRAFVYHSPDNWGQAMLAHVWSGGSAESRDHLVLDPASGTDNAGNIRTTTYNDGANFRWLGSSQSETPIFDAAHVGRWYCIEVQARLNTPGSSDGVFRLWVDDELEAEREGLNWVGGYQGYGINAVFLENFWNNGSPVAQERYFDNFVVSTTRIGCG